MATAPVRVPLFTRRTQQILADRLELAAERLELRRPELEILLGVVLPEQFGVVLSEQSCESFAARPTAARPGTHAKVNEMVRRRKAGLPLFSPLDVFGGPDGEGEPHAGRVGAEYVLAVPIPGRH